MGETRGTRRCRSASPAETPVRASAHRIPRFLPSHSLLHPHLSRSPVFFKILTPFPLSPPSLSPFPSLSPTVPPSLHPRSPHPPCSFSPTLSPSLSPTLFPPLSIPPSVPLFVFLSPSARPRPFRHSSPPILPSLNSPLLPPLLLLLLPTPFSRSLPPSPSTLPTPFPPHLILFSQYIAIAVAASKSQLHLSLPHWRYIDPTPCPPIDPVARPLLNFVLNRRRHSRHLHGPCGETGSCGCSARGADIHNQSASPLPRFLSLLSPSVIGRRIAQDRRREEGNGGKFVFVS